MRKLMLGLGVAVAVSGGGVAAQAGTIAAGSVLSLSGGLSVDQQDKTITFDFANSLNTALETGSFSELGTGGTVALDNAGTAIKWDDLTSGSTLACGGGCIYAATNDGMTTTFDLTAETVTKAADSLDISGTGTATLTGYDPTQGTFVLTTQLNGGRSEVSFSTTTSVPEPATMTILAAGLLSLGLTARWRRA